MESPAKPATGAKNHGVDGGVGTLEELLPSVYNGLRRLAKQYLSHERPDHTLQATALVHEAYLRLADQRAVPWQNQAYLFVMAAQMMRRILVNHARDRRRLKRGGGLARLTLEDRREAASSCSVDLVELDEALAKLATRDEQQSRVVELRYFGGLTIAETASVLEVSAATVKNKWNVARAWLFRELCLGGGNGS
jgi:RNA polymerase sigma factor (TIGR02999 family)